jgi:formylmethanofuran dehydrogenase subunit B
MSTSVISAATCLGCGCTCDDIEVLVSNGHIVETRNTCALGRQWFGGGAAPGRATISGHEVSINEATERAVTLLSRARTPHVLLASDVSCETYREAVACADLLRARLDLFAAPSDITAILATQERGIATATLGEIRNRADAVVFWGVDPASSFPRFQSRYAPDPIGIYCPDGRRSRTVVAVDVGDRRGPSDADVRVPIAPESEAVVLQALAASLTLTASASLDPHVPGGPAVRELEEHLRGRRYVAVVADAVASGTHNDRIHRLLALAQALNVQGRGALCLLRPGGNHSGAEAVVTRQTGYPAAVDFASGVPRYRPHAGAAQTEHDCLLIIGAPAGVSTTHAGPASSIVAIGPGATDSAFGPDGVMIDSATAGIHAGGTAVRMDDVPISLRAVISGPPDATVICQGLRSGLQRECR